MKDLVRKAQGGDTPAFEALIRRYQNMAFGCALSRVGDYQRAEDVVQEAFLAAYYGLDRLANVDAFGGWLRRIVIYQCARVLREPSWADLPPDWAEQLVAQDDPAQQLMQTYEADVVIDAVRALPETQSEIVLLYYMDDRSQREIADLLGIPVATVNNRLHAARKNLKRSTIAMLRETLAEKKLGNDFATKVGEIVKVRGPIVDVRLLGDENVQALDSLQPGDAAGSYVVAQRLGGGLVRCVPVRRRGAETGEQPAAKTGVGMVRADADIQEEVGEAEVARIVDAFVGNKPTQRAIVETGIKVIDLFAPLTAGGSVGLFGLWGVGKGVVLGELTRRLAQRDVALTLVGLGKRVERSMGQESIRKDSEFFGLVDKAGGIQSVHLVTDLASDPDYARRNTVFDSSIYCSVEIAAKNIWPAVDPLVSHGKALVPEIAGPEHCSAAAAAREALARAAEIMVDPVFLRYLAHGARERATRRAESFLHERLAALNDNDRLLVERARRLELFLGQPLIVAEPYTGRPGAVVPLAETLSSVADILNGRYDSVPAEAFRFKGGMDEVLAAA